LTSSKNKICACRELAVSDLLFRSVPEALNRRNYLGTAKVQVEVRRMLGLMATYKSGLELRLSLDVVILEDLI
jgi:hypothetical protein